MKKIFVNLFIVFLFLSTSAMAAPLIPTYNNDGFADLYDAVNLLLGTSYTGNDQIADRQTNNDEIWINNSEYISEPWAVIGLSASYYNSFGVYSDVGVGMDRSVLWSGSGFGLTGDGSISNPFDGGQIGTFISEGAQFGFFLNSNQTNLLYSETVLNQGNMDYMTTYALPELLGQRLYYTNTDGWFNVLSTPYLIGFEDILGGGDSDYDDLMVLVTKVSPAPVPEPATMLLLGTGLIGIALIGRRNLFNK